MTSAMRRTVHCALAAAIAFSASRAAAQDEGAVPDVFPARGVVNAKRLNVRRGPDVNPPIGQLPRGAEVTVRKRHGTWLEIDYPALFGPWVSAICVESDADLQAATDEAPLRAEINRDGARVRSVPAQRGLVLAEVPRGTLLTVVGFVNGWCRIVPPADLRVYVHAGFVDIVAGDVAVGEGSQPRPVPGASVQSANTGLPAAVEEKIAFAAELLSADESLLQVESALRLLEEAMTSEELSDTERAVARRKVSETIGELPPAKWLKLLELARESNRKRLEDIDRRYAAQLRDARDSLRETPQVEFTAQGVLRVADEIAGTYRLFAGDVLVCELDAGAADLMAFVGKHVGVVGRRRADAGETAVVDVEYVEEIDVAVPPQ
jgi:hypothetical protein